MRLLRILFWSVVTAFLVVDAAAQVNVPANRVNAGPASGTAAPAKFRALVADDVPSLPWSKITTTPTTLAGYGITDGQSTLISGTNIRTLEGLTLLGSTNIDLGKVDVGLGNVDNTSDANKPISTATQTALDLKQNLLTPAAIARVDDTNVTAVLTGTPTTALLQPVTITLGWTGTLAAARLNSNVVQAVTNETNITGSISAQTLTFAWSGTLAAARLNANVVQAFVNDTNVTGSISTQTATLGWTGTLAYARFVSGGGLSVVGRSANTSGVQADITGTANQVLRVSGTTLAFGAVDLAAMVGATVLPVANGGTNVASYAVGDLLYASASTTLSKLADVAAGSYLRSGGVTTAPLWSTLILPNAATSTRLVYATSTNTYGESASLTFTGGNTLNTVSFTASGNITGSGRMIINNATYASDVVAVASGGAAFTANSVNLISTVSTASGRNTSGDSYGAFTAANSFATGNTNQTLTLFNATGTFTTNNTGGTLSGYSFTPTLAGTQLASIVVKAWSHTAGIVQWNSVLSLSFDADQTDYNPSGFNNTSAPYGAVHLRVAGLSATRTINSLNSGGFDGRILIITNTTAQSLQLLGDDGSTGTAAQRFAGATYTIGAGRSAHLIYDGTSSRWRIQN